MQSAVLTNLIRSLVVDLQPRRCGLAEQRRRHELRIPYDVIGSIRGNIIWTFRGRSGLSTGRIRGGVFIREPLFERLMFGSRLRGRTSGQQGKTKQTSGDFDFHSSGSG
jgi:hypothetical protein